MFYLTTHSTHFICGYFTGKIRFKTLAQIKSQEFIGHIKQQILSHVINGIRKEGNYLFNDALNTFYLRLLYGVRHMVKDHSDSERGNRLPPHGLLFPISSKGSFICIIPQTGYHIPQPLLHQLWNTG